MDMREHVRSRDRELIFHPHEVESVESINNSSTGIRSKKCVLVKGVARGVQLVVSLLASVFVCERVGVSALCVVGSFSKRKHRLNTKERGRGVCQNQCMRRY